MAKNAVCLHCEKNVNGIEKHNKDTGHEMFKDKNGEFSLNPHSAQYRKGSESSEEGDGDE